MRRKNCETFSEHPSKRARNAMNVKNHLLTSVLGGEVITLLTRKLPNVRPMPAGATQYGYPFAWLIRLQIPPEYFPWRINPANLLVDIAIWSVVVGIVLFAVQRAREFFGQRKVGL